MKLDPTAARALTLMSQFQSTLQGRFHHMNNGVFKASDETKSVQVTRNGYQWLTGIRHRKRSAERGGRAGGR